MGRRRAKPRQGEKSNSSQMSNTETLPEQPDTYDDINCPLHVYLKCMVAAPEPGQLVKVLVKGRAIVKKGQPMFVMVASLSNNSFIDLLYLALMSESIKTPLHLTYEISRDRQFEVVARMDGQVVPVFVKNGSFLREGQPLFFLAKPTNEVVPTSSQMSDFMHSVDIIRKVSLKELFGDFKAAAAAEYKPMATLDDDDQDVLKSFNKFDTVSDHLFSLKIQPSRPTNDWAENIKKEWISLQEGLPDTIYVRAYESRMDLLRAVIIGLEGTPYHNGLFFFDVFLPQGYPYKPPRVRYHSGGLIINPNMKNVEVYLKLPSTDSEEEKEEDMWVPGTSNMLQLLVSIQKRILCANPLLCDVRVAKHTSLYAKHSAMIYRENTFIKSLKTMEYIINNPPKNFEDFVVGHFRNHATDILVACKEEASKESCTTTLKRYLDLCFNLLVVAFIKIGAKLPQDFLPLVEKRSLQFA